MRIGNVFDLNLCNTLFWLYFELIKNEILCSAIQSRRPSRCRIRKERGKWGFGRLECGEEKRSRFG